MKDTNQQTDYYGQYYMGLIAAQDYMMTEINKLLVEIKSESYNPAEHVLSRIKSADSLQKKQKLRKIKPGIKNALLELSDIIGCRIVTHFLGDVYLLIDAIEQSDKWTVVQIKDYIQDPKPNGYRSCHLILKIPFEDDAVRHIYAEIQMRTIAMDCWAALEHEIKYKKEIKDVELITSELKRCADEIASTDLSLQTLRDTIINQ